MRWVWEEFSNSSVENENPSRRGEMKLRKNEMKVRKKEMKVRKNFSFPRWIIPNLHRDCLISSTPFDFLHRDVDELIRYNALALGSCQIPRETRRNS